MLTSPRRGGAAVLWAAHLLTSACIRSEDAQEGRKLKSPPRQISGAEMLCVCSYGSWLILAQLHSDQLCTHLMRAPLTGESPLPTWTSFHLRPVVLVWKSSVATR